MNNVIVDKDKVFTVGELIEELKKIPTDYEVYINTKDAGVFYLTSLISYEFTGCVLLGD
jgi:hypothetical protein